ncbi:MAG: hypothetical protein A3J24_06155 [Deltaproteobacteria bacterium RIFCSPLOWO2_02_FULL_53_8]|nr:MAG: hypothetical protein A3J24_06155 [Deltaproteobacteria bacterium RIFCSPLOWO2_02_FULL_53_8]
MSHYETIKELVIDVCVTGGSFPNYEKLTALVMKFFPNSKWQKTHYAWYKSKIKTGKIELPGGIKLQWDSDAVASTDNSDDDIMQEQDAEDSIEMKISLERDLQIYFAQKLNEIEHGLSLVKDGVEYNTTAGRIDILAKDSNGGLVVIELKAGKANDKALGQILGYIGCLSGSENAKNVRGILIASSFEPRVVFAAKNLPQVKLVKYQLSFNLDEIE